MYISFNPGISFKQNGIQGAPKGAQEANAAAQGGVQGTDMSQKPAPKQPKKRSSLREDISKIAKFFTTLGEMTKASFKASFLVISTPATFKDSIGVLVAPNVKNSK